ncbi:YdcF family protein [Rhodoferax aquaticus]|uniref:YdcF family protein n=1 Tax=Rhodoferax aquaticus TaxID=2527691 RepID=A0A515EMG8_9BURK|nr:YdcF family protein [Rhodoferax aquaticus]QDL53850.1 YdcF family protein [Rhodoferax aquaticus]
MFVASKILDVVTQPLWYVLALMLAGLWFIRSHPMRARRLWVAASLVLLLIGWSYPRDRLGYYLESQYEEMDPKADLSAYVGVVVLGGATESGELQQAHLQPLLAASGERLTTAVALIHRNPHLRVIYTGGEGTLMGSGPSEAERARVFYTTMGLADARIEYESKSRNTHENAAFSANMPNVDIRQRWLLVTSATHMPRSMATFKKAGWNVTAYPVDYQSKPAADWLDYSIAKGPPAWDIILHEYLGIAVYRLTGRM